jgi:hypothetical protein
MSFTLSNLKENPVEERVKILNEFQMTSGVLLCVILSDKASFVESLYC